MSGSRDFSSSYMSVIDGDVAPLDVTTPLTFSCWFNTDVTNPGTFLSKYLNATNGYLWVFRINTARIGLFVLDGAGAGHEGFSPSAVRTGVWMHAAGRIRLPGTTNAVQAWLNGVVGTGDSLPSIHATPNNQVVKIGRSYAGASDNMDGRIADMAMWNDALNDEEIMRLAKGWRPPQIRPGNLAGYWPLEDYGSSGQTEELRWNSRMSVTTGTVTARPGPDLPFLAPHIHLQSLTPPNFSGAPIADMPGVLSG